MRRGMGFILKCRVEVWIMTTKQSLRKTSSICRGRLVQIASLWPAQQNRSDIKERKQLHSRLDNVFNCPAQREQPHLLCSAFGMFGSQMKGHQSLVRPLPSADIAEHRASYTSALLGLCLQSESRRGPRRGGKRQRGNTPVIKTCGVWVTQSSLPRVDEYISI